jgi:hypothetical protein
MTQLLISNLVTTTHCRSVYERERSALFLQFSRHLIALLVATTPVADTSSVGMRACACAYAHTHT